MQAGQLDDLLAVVCELLQLNHLLGQHFQRRIKEQILDVLLQHALDRLAVEENFAEEELDSY